MTHEVPEPGRIIDAALSVDAGLYAPARVIRQEERLGSTLVEVEFERSGKRKTLLWPSPAFRVPPAEVSDLD